LSNKNESATVLKTKKFSELNKAPNGIALDAVFVHPSVVDMLDTAVGDAIENGHWYC